MQLNVITVPSVEATPERDGMLPGLGQGGDAFVAAGLYDDLADWGATVERTARPELPDAELTDDRIVNLGRYNGLIAAAVAAGIADEERGGAVGGTCSHLLGMMGGLQQAYGPAAKIGLVWFDAHGDFNTPRTSHSGMLGGMPVAVSAGLCHATWRELAGQSVPLPTDRLLFVDVRHLDPKEAALIYASDARVAAISPGRAGHPLARALAELADRADHLYFHVDADILDRRFQPNHPTAEPNGPDIETTQDAIDQVMATGKVRAFGLVSVNPTGPDGAVSLASGRALLERAVTAWSAAAHA